MSVSHSTNANNIKPSIFSEENQSKRMSDSEVHTSEKVLTGGSRKQSLSDKKNKPPLENNGSGRGSIGSGWLPGLSYLFVEDSSSETGSVQESAHSERTINSMGSVDQSVLKKSSILSLKQTPVVGQIKSHWISGLTFGYWGLGGPKTEQVWHGCDVISEELQAEIARFTLPGGDVSRHEKDLERVESKFQVISELSYIFISTLFTANWQKSSKTCSLALVIKSRYLSRYLTLYPLAEDRLLQLVLKLKTLLSAKSVPKTDVFSHLHPEVLNMAECLDQWEKCKLPPIHFSRTMLTNETQYDSEFLCKAITSHLQTHGYTVVVGNREDQINRLIDTLSYFSLSPSDNERSAYASGGRPFIPDLVLQGTVQMDITKEEVIQATCPCTIIDLNTNTVKQTLPYHEFVVLRKNYFQNELLKIAGKKPKDNLWTAQESLFGLVPKGAPIIEEILKELSHLPMSLREGYIKQSMRLLIRKGILLSKYVEAELRETRKKSPDSTYLSAQTRRKIRENLDIGSEATFLVLMGIAERLQPGIYDALSASIEDRFNELFESF